VRLVRRVPLVDARGYAYHSLRFSPDGKLLAAEDRFRITVYEAATGRVVGMIRERDLSPDVFRWSADGKTLTLLTEGKVGKGGDVAPPLVHEWDPASGKLRSLDAPARSEDSSRDGRVSIETTRRSVALAR